MDEKKWNDKLKEKIEGQINNQVEVNKNNIDYVMKLIDIIKDIENIEYWKEKINMYSANYGDYNEGYGRRGVPGTGRYREGSYGRRGVPGSGRGRYRGESLLDEMYETYNDYMDGQMYGNYGTNESMMKIEIMAESLMDFVNHLKKEAKSPEEKQLIEQKLKELGKM